MTYTIKRGKHYSTTWIGMLGRFLFGWQVRNYAVARVSFSESCLTPSEDADDINKLFGLAFGLRHHHIDSIRVGWRANGSKIDLFAYEYLDGERKGFRHICHVFPRRQYYITIYMDEAGRSYFVVRSKSEAQLGATIGWQHKTSFIKRRLYPYFGGTYPAPKTMEIQVEWL